MSKPFCYRCGLGVDDDRDGNCAVCAALDDAHVKRIVTNLHPAVVRAIFIHTSSPLQTLRTMFKLVKESF